MWNWGWGTVKACPYVLKEVCDILHRELGCRMDKQDKLLWACLSVGASSFITLIGLIILLVKMVIQ
jgi:hypothetical protein